MNISANSARSTRNLSTIVGLCLIVLLSGCANRQAAIKTDACPFPEWMDEKVAEELETNLPYEGNEDTWSWLSRIEKLNEKLELAHD